MASDIDPEVLEQLARWRDAVHTALEDHTDTVLTVTAVDLPGALTVQVAADSAGTRTARDLVNWAKPSLALVRPPDDEDQFFTIALVSSADRRDVVLQCGEAPEPEDFFTRRERELDLTDDDVERIASILQAELETWLGSDDWHPALSGQFDRELDRLLDRTFPEDKFSERERRQAIFVAAIVLRVQEQISQIRQEQKELHRMRAMENPDAIAQDLLDGPHATALRRGTQVERTAVVSAIMKEQCPCLTKAICTTIARAIPRWL
ncbi:hypothetical protein [Luteococcus sanguinis]|uniref:Uncharacterized protein n=1 Tax=Luteococcus sanguinis TaxID=174038 RepID=A0ABW1X0G2_9ACTN